MRRPLAVALALCCLLSHGVAAAPLAGDAGAAVPAANAGPPASTPPTDAPADAATRHALAEPSLPSSGPSADRSAPLAVGARLQDDCPDAPGIVCLPNTTNHLAPDRANVVGTSFEDSTLDVSAALSTDSARTTERLRARTFQIAFEHAETDAQRRAVVERFADRLENRSTALRERQREALAAYNDGEISDEQFLQTLARLAAAGDRLERAIATLDRYRDRADADVSDARLGELYTDVVALDGPVRDRLTAVYDGARPPTRVFVETSEDGIVLAAIVDGAGSSTFVREAHLLDARGSGTADRYDGNPTRVVDRASALYPWTFDNRGPTQINIETRPFGAVGTYRIVKYHPQGRLTTFLDGGTDRVFAEYQRKQVDRLPTATTVKTNESAGLTMTVERSYAGGPLNVTVTDAETGRPLDAAVRVNNRSLGTTGEDGSLLTVAPRSVIVTVSVEYEGRTVTLSRTLDGRDALAAPEAVRGAAHVSTPAVGPTARPRDAKV